MSKDIRTKYALLFDTNYLINFTSNVSEDAKQKAREWYTFYSQYDLTCFCSEIVISEFNVWNDFSIFEKSLNIKRLPFSQLQSTICSKFSKELLKSYDTYEDYFKTKCGIDKIKEVSKNDWKRIFGYLKDTIKDDLKIISTYVSLDNTHQKILLTSDPEIKETVSTLDIGDKYNIRIVNYLQESPTDFSNYGKLFAGNIDNEK